MSKAVQFHEIGGPEVLKIEDWEAPALATGEVLLDVAAFALNRADILFFQGLHYSLPKLPSRLGSERAPCPHGCDRALEHAIMTAPDMRDPDLVARLDAVAGRVL